MEEPGDPQHIGVHFVARSRRASAEGQAVARGGMSFSYQFPADTFSDVARPAAELVDQPVAAV